MMTDKILVDVADAIATITFNNPERRNAVSLDMWEAVEAALARMEDDDAVRVVIITGAGDKAFVSGADISKFESERAEAEAVATYNAATARVYGRLYSFPKPVIAKIKGACVGGGLNLAFACDLRICNQSARFAMPAAKLGLGYGYDSLKRLAHVVGLPNALELAYTAKLFPAEDAFHMGAVNRVVADEELDAFVEDYANRIAANAPLTIRTFKAGAVELRKHESDRDMARLDALVAQCFGSEDYVEGRRAFMEKRKPAFKGR
jgi:enoyl-CoA hydratase/carnithine racemase